ncbi:MAG: maltose alpha-D-glucosyltransferase [Chloroflexota bacterium]|nr:maltose alpha-D-glucosyltransferase [Chloroflexota bacterium]
MPAEKHPWYMNAMFYEVHIRAYRDANADGKGDLAGLVSKLDYIQSLGVDCIWILPMYGSPLQDGGYDISDYYSIHPDYGTIEDFKTLVDQAHQRGMRVIADLVLNHTSDQHPWFQAARSDPDSQYRDYYVWSDTDEKYSDARIIFLDTEESNWTYDEKAGQYYWHRFYATQPDLNYDNPAVREEMLNVMSFWLDLGIDGFRADAVPYLIEREGTNCENLPETHEILKSIRAYLDAHYEDKVLLAEANQWPKDVRPYFGDGDEFNMGFHFPVMPRIFMALRREDATPIRWIMAQTPAIPENTQWCTFLRNHDELTLEMVTEEERQWMWSEYAPEPRMRLNLGIRRRLAPLLDNDQRKIMLANALLYSLPGAPIIYYGDEIGMGDNIWLPDRDGVRTPMQWDDSHNAGFSDAPSEILYEPVIDEGAYSYKVVNVAAEEPDPRSLLNRMRHLIQVRKDHPILAVGDYEFWNQDQNELLTIHRFMDDEHLICLLNLTGENQKADLDLSAWVGARIEDLLSEELFPPITEGPYTVSLGPWVYRWLSLAN